MKKLILSLFTLATVFVACDKDDSVIETPGLEAEVIVTNSGDIIDDAFDFLGGIDAPKGSQSTTSKVGASGSDWIHVVFFDHNSQNLALLRGDGTDEVCWDNLTGFARSVIYTWDTNTNILTLTVETAAGEVVAPGRLQSDASAARFDRLFGANTLNRVRVTNSRRSAAITGTPPSASLFDFSCPSTSVDVGGAYAVTRAPFPLTGYLATINSSFDFITNSLDANAANYAGTSEQSVRNAIEGDILNMENYTSTTPLIFD